MVANVVNLAYFAVLCFLLYRTYARAKKAGIWSWKQFFGIIGAILAFGGLVIFPLAYSNLSATRPTLFYFLMFGGIALFALAMIVYSIRIRKGWARRLQVEQRTPGALPEE